MKKNGFTAIELMIVIAILAILFAIAWPFISGEKGDAEAMQEDEVLIEETVEM